MDEALIELAGVGKSFGSTVVLEDVHASFPAGAVSGILGGNGSGKSILFKLICGLVRPTTGSITMSSRVRRPKDTYPYNLGALIEGPGYVPGASGMENLEELAKINRRANRDDILRYSDLLGLTPHLHKKVRHYSVGTKQKLGLVQAMMEEPVVLLLDEPFNGLDSEASGVLAEILRNWPVEGRSVIFSSHIPGTVSTLATHTWQIADHTLSSYPIR